MLKRSLLLGLTAGVLAGLVSVLYKKIYVASLGEDFAGVIKPIGILATSVLAGLLAALGYWLLQRWLKGKGELVFNFVFMILVFASILGPFSVKLPLDIEMPELFPGLAVPMHFFPALAWFTLKPLFVKQPG